MARKSVIATNLAQEQLEYIRNLRDNNLKKGKDAFCNDPTSGCIFLVNSIDNGWSYNRSGLGFSKVDGFTGLVVISGGDDPKEITSTVKWNAAGTPKSVTLTDTLSAWGQ